MMQSPGCAFDVALDRAETDATLIVRAQSDEDGGGVGTVTVIAAVSALPPGSLAIAR